MYLVPLTKKQRKLVKAVAHLYLINIRSVLEDDDEMDTKLLCILEQIEEEELKKHIKKALRKWVKIKNKPSMITSMDKDDRDIFKTLLVRFFDKKKYRTVRGQIWKKLDAVCFVAEFSQN